LSVRVKYKYLKDFYGIWSKVARYSGMSPSIGKNFISDEMVLINSTPFIITQYRGAKLVPRVNPGLIQGQGRVRFDDRDLTPKKLDEYLMAKGDQLKDVQRYAVGLEREDLINELFLFYNLDLLKRTKRSWRLPQSLGGLGLPFGTVSPAAEQYANGVMQGKYRPCFEKTKTFGTKYFSDLYGNKIRKANKTNYRPPEYAKIKDLDDRFSTIDFDKLGEYVPSVGHEYDPTDTLPKYLQAITEEVTDYDKYLSDSKDAQRHPYLRIQRDWLTFLKEYQLVGTGGYFYPDPETVLPFWELQKYRKETASANASYDALVNFIQGQSLAALES